jgi:hypothetical protein
MNLLISFPDQSESFTYGVEYGRILQQMEQGDSIICNKGFPIRVENRKLIEDTCKSMGYIPTFGKTHFDEWIEFLGIKKNTSEQ